MPDPASQYITGQRWISNTEPELGLGILVDCANRRVNLSFPASGEERTYALDNAPLSRVRYRIGERIADAEDNHYTVLDVNETKGYVIYLGENEAGESVVVPEVELNSFVQFSSPKERLFSGQIDRHDHFQLRYNSLLQQGRLQHSAARGLLGARVQLLPHQLYIADEVGRRHAPRVLLADEVGLGKTIEAGLIVHQQLSIGRARRVLVVVPDSLVHQWLVEMLRRFNLKFTILDEQRCASAAVAELLDSLDMPGEVEEDSAEENPFEGAQLVLCSLSFLRDKPQRQQQALAADWDLLVVDEAHHLAWSPEQVSPAYACIEALAQQALGLLLLTATPEQLGIESHFARLRLLDPDRYHDLEKFRAEEARYQPVNDLVQQLLNTATDQLFDDASTRKALADYLGEERVDSWQAKLADTDNPDAARDNLIRELLDHYGTGRVLFRNTRATVSGFPTRLLHAHPLTASEEQQTQLQSAESLAQRLQPEPLFGEDWPRHDPRVAWLTDWLKADRQRKALVICAQAETAKALENHLRLSEGVYSAVFHEGLSLVERDRAAAWFADMDDGAQTLVCSEIGSEGRNFQFTQHLVLFDLPLNPDLLEQRIGRLDRIGQPGDVNIHVPYLEGTAQERLLRWYDEGLQAFTRSFQAGQNVLARFGERLEQQLTKSDEHFDALISDTRQHADEVLAELQQGRDRLLELHSCDPIVAEQLIDSIAEAERPGEVSDYMDRVFDVYGVEQEPHSANAVVIRPGDHMLDNHFPALPSDGMTATYRRDIALSREDLHFLSWEHPMVSGALDLILSSDIGNTALISLKVKGLQPGTLLAECIFTLKCSAPKSLQLERYLPQTPVRVLFDSEGRDLTALVSNENLNQVGKKVHISTAQDVARQARAQLEKTVAKAEASATQQQDQVIAQAIADMRAAQQLEIDRLTALARINPNIRAEEIDYVSEVMESQASYLAGAQLRMEALRVAVAT